MYPVYLIFLKHLSRWNPQILKSSNLIGLLFTIQTRVWNFHANIMWFLCSSYVASFSFASLLPHSFPMFSFSDFSSLSSHINWIESKVYKFIFLQWFIRHVPPYTDTCRPFNTTGNFKSWIVFFFMTTLPWRHTSI